MITAPRLWSLSAYRRLHSFQDAVELVGNLDYYSRLLANLQLKLVTRDEICIKGDLSLSMHINIYIYIYEYMIYTYWAHHFLTFLPKEEKQGNQLFFWMALRKLIVWILAPCVCSLCTKFRNNNQHEFLKLMRRLQRQKKTEVTKGYRNRKLKKLGSCWLMFLSKILFSVFINFRFFLFHFHLSDYCNDKLF